MKELDYEKAEIRQLSSDAFFLLLKNEPPLDEDNIKEANEIREMFPDGFEIEDSWKYIEDGCIEAKFIPYAITESNEAEWEFEWRCFNSKGKDRHAFKYNSDNSYIWLDEETGRIISQGKFELQYINKKPWAILPSKSSVHTQIPLWNSY